MPLHLTSCVPVREPGFSASECLELARRIESGALIVCSQMLDEGLSHREVATIVIALRAYAR